MYIQKNNNGIKESANTDPIWKLVHDNKSVLLLKEISGRLAVNANSSLFVADKKEECLAEIEKLELILPEELK